MLNYTTPLILMQYLKINNYANFSNKHISKQSVAKINEFLFNNMHIMQFDCKSKRGKVPLFCN